MKNASEDARHPKINRWCEASPFVLLLLCPWIVAPKCFSTDPYYIDAGEETGAGDDATASIEDASNSDSSTEDVQTMDADLPDSGFDPAQPCAASAQFPAGVARIRISARTF